MWVSRRNESLEIRVGNREPKEIDPFKYLGSMVLQMVIAQGK